MKILRDDQDFKQKTEQEEFARQQKELKEAILAEKHARGDFSDPPEVKEYYSTLVENFLMRFIEIKLQKVKLHKRDLLKFVKPSDEKEAALLKILANSDEPPKARLIEIKQPESE